MNLQIPFFNPKHLSLNAIEQKFNYIQNWNTIDKINWSDYSYCPQVRFKIFHTNKQIVLKFHVVEDSIRAVNNTFNSPVFQDSCCEFFIGMDDINYYNFEFNCIGAVLAGYGADRQKRNYLDTKYLDNILVYTSIEKHPFELKIEKTEWWLIAVIPISVFHYNSFSNFSEIIAKGNFYKCGDKTMPVHYVSWSEINLPKPDFHCPEFFGNITFE